jgi:hypothetical protein
LNSESKRPVGITLLSLFFVFGALMSGLAFVLLMFPGIPFDFAWRLNPGAHIALSALGWRALLLMSATSLACATAALGLWRCRRWGLWTAVAILVINLMGDTGNSLLLGDKRALIGLPIGGLLVWYLLSQRGRFVR